MRPASVPHHSPVGKVLDSIALRVNCDGENFHLLAVVATERFLQFRELVGNGGADVGTVSVDKCHHHHLARGVAKAEIVTMLVN